MKIVRVIVALILFTALAHAGDFFIHNGDRVVFLGDSITAQRLYTTYLEAYALTRHPDWQLTFRNVGWGGDTSWLRKRAHTDEARLFAAQGDEQKAMIEQAVASGLGRDVLPLKPTIVTIKFGMNDHAYQPFRPDIFKAYVASQTELVRVLQQNGARVALLTPQPIEDKRADPDKDVRNLSLRKFSDGLQVVAREHGTLFVDQFAPFMSIMMKERAGNPHAHIGGGDAVHPGPAGHTIMAWAILKNLGATPLVSAVEIKHCWWKWAADTQNCRVTNIKMAGGVLSFDRMDQALPMPIDPRAGAALKLAPILEDLNRYELKVLGLPAGNYTVAVDGEVVATLSAAELAKGWNMALAKGVVNKQVQSILALIFKKNDLFYTRWNKVQLNPARQSELPQLDQQIAELEAQINAARQPMPHHFELKPVS